eukprot:363937-Chlamydomonas_euryale.AAC.13
MHATYLVDPVRVENPHTPDLAANALLRHRAQVAGGLQLRDTLVDGLAVDNTLRHMMRIENARRIHFKFKAGKGVSCDAPPCAKSIAHWPACAVRRARPCQGLENSNTLSTQEHGNECSPVPTNTSPPLRGSD